MQIVLPISFSTSRCHGWKIFVLNLTRLQAARVESESEMRLKLIETKPHTWPVCPEKESILSHTYWAFAIGWVLWPVHHGDPKQHLSKFADRNGGRVSAENQGARTGGAMRLSIFLVAAAFLQIGKLMNRACRLWGPTRLLTCLPHSSPICTSYPSTRVCFPSVSWLQPLPGHMA